MMKIILILCEVVLLCSILVMSEPPTSNNNNAFKTSTCPNPTHAGKTDPSEETELHACKQYSCNSCCTSNMTIELAAVPLKQVGLVNFDQCAGLSTACSMDFAYIECMYRCSPNLFPWISSTTKKLSGLPICASFCDAWFYTCKNDFTCAVGKGNLITDIYKGFNPDGTPKQPCKEPVTCRNYSTVYQSGKELCNNIWGNLFIYTNDTENCLNPAKPAENAKMVQAMDSSFEVSDCVTTQVTYTDAGLIVGVVFGVLAGIFLIVAGVLLYMKKKKGKDSPATSAKPKPKEPAAAEEMATLRSSTKEKPPTPSNTAGHSDSDVAEA